MAMFQCPECGTNIADNSVSCPSCGWKNKFVAAKKSVNRWSIVSIILTLIGIYWTLLIENALKIEANGYRVHDITLNGVPIGVVLSIPLILVIVICIMRIAMKSMKKSVHIILAIIALVLMWGDYLFASFTGLFAGSTAGMSMIAGITVTSLALIASMIASRNLRISENQQVQYDMTKASNLNFEPSQKDEKSLAMIKCPHCDALQDSKQKICEYCGLPLISNPPIIQENIGGSDSTNTRYSTNYGNILDNSASIHPNCNEATKGTIFDKIGTIIGIILAVICLIMLFPTESGPTLLSAILFFVAALIFLPFIKKLIRNVTHGNKSAQTILFILRWILAIALMLISFGIDIYGLPTSSGVNSTNHSSEETYSETKQRWQDEAQSVAEKRSLDTYSKFDSKFHDISVTTTRIEESPAGGTYYVWGVADGTDNYNTPYQAKWYMHVNRDLDGKYRVSNEDYNPPVKK